MCILCLNTKDYYPNGGVNQPGCNSIIGRRSNFVNDKAIYELDHMIYHAKFGPEADEPGKARF